MSTLRKPVSRQRGLAHNCRTGGIVMTQNTKRLLVCISGNLLCLAAVVPAPVLAQSAGAMALEEVTVTARKRSENLQDVPLPPPNGPKLGLVLRDPRTYGVNFNARF